MIQKKEQSDVRKLCYCFNFFYNILFNINKMLTLQVKEDNLYNNMFFKFSK